MFSGWTPRYGGSTGYPAAPAADQGLQSFRDQHLAQLEQLQKMHQRQLESVLPVGAPPPPRPYYSPRQPYPYPPPYGHNVPPPGYQATAPPSDADNPPPPPPTTDQPPPPPPPDSGPPTGTSSLEEQQQYWYKQHLLNLQQKAKSHGRDAPSPALETVAPPPAGYVPAPPSQQPPPPPMEEAKPPLPVENVATGINLPEDPEQAERLKTLQEAAAHWQQHEQHRLGFQYQGIMQKHSAMQQLLQRYQQIVQDPPHMAAMTVDVQIQHYEMQQKQFLALHLEWDNQYKKWQELLQTYPHKDQLQEYQVQWASWQSHMKTTKTHLKDKVASLKNLKQQYGGNHYIGGIPIVPSYPAYSPVMSPAVPAALPTVAGLQPSYTAPVPPIYGTGPPPSLPPAMTYSEVTPPLPAVTAPPLPPASSVPPPPPPVSSPAAETVQPPLPPAPEIQPPPPAASAVSAPESQTSSSIPTPAPPSASPSITSSSAVSSATFTVSQAVKEPPSTQTSFIHGDQTFSAGLSYQAQQALRNSQPQVGQSAPPVPSHNPPSEVPLPSMEKQREETKHVNPLGPHPALDLDRMSAVPPLPTGIQTGQNEGSRERIFTAQGHSFAPPRYPPPGSHDFQGSHSIPDRENQYRSNEQKNQSTPTDKYQHYGEVSNRIAPANRWDRPKDTLDQPWDRPKPPQVSEAPAKDISDYPPGPMSDRESNRPSEMWNRPDGPQFNRTSSQGDDMRNKWDQPPDGRWSGSKEPCSERWSNTRDRWGVENTSAPIDRFGDTQNSGSNRFGGSEAAPFERYGDGMGPPFDRHNAPDVPFRNRFGHPEGPPHLRFNNPDMQPRGRARFPTIPPRGRFPFPESHPRPRFGAPDGRPPSYGYSDTLSRDRFMAPEHPPSQDLMAGQEKSHAQQHFGGVEQAPSQERFGCPEPPSHQEGPRDSKIPPPHHQFRGPNIPTPHDRFGGPDVPDRLKGSEFPPPGERFKGPEMPLPPGERFKGPEMPSPAGERFKGPEMPSPAGERFKGPEMPSPAGERFKGPEMPSPAGERFKGPEMPSPAGERFKGPEMPPPPGERCGVSEMPSSLQNRFGDFDGPQRGNRSHSDKDSFGTAETHLYDSRDNRVPFRDRWGSVDSKGRPEWAEERGDVGNRAPLLGNTLQKPAIQSNTENIPKDSYQSKLIKKEVTKEADVCIGADPFPSGQRNIKQEQQDVEMKQVNKPSSEVVLIAESPAIQETLKNRTSESSEVKKPNETLDSSLFKTKTADLPKTGLPGSQTLSAQSKLNEPLAASSVPSDKSKDQGQTDDINTADKSQIESPVLNKAPASEAAKPDVHTSSHTIASKLEEPTGSVRKQDAFQIPSTTKQGGLLPTPTTGLSVPFASHTTPPFRPQTPHTLPLARPRDPWGPPIRPADPWAPPVRPGDPRAAPPVRLGGPRAGPPIRPGGPRAAPPIRPGGPRGAPPVRLGGPRAAPPIRPGGPRAPPPVRLGGPRAVHPVRPAGPREGYPVRPGAPFSGWEDPFERTVHGEGRNVYAASMGPDSMCEDPYTETHDEDVMGGDHPHGPEGHHSRPEFSNPEEDDEDDYFHNEPGRPGGFRDDDFSLEPEPYLEDWPENYDMRFDHRGRGRARGFMRGRLLSRPGSHEMMDILDERGFEPRGHLPPDRPMFRDGMNEPPPFGREDFLREARFADRERFPLVPPLELRRRDIELEEARLHDWERERFLRAHDPDLLREPFMEQYMRDERLPLRPPPLPHDIDIRRDPWHDRFLEEDMERVGYNRLERPQLFERDLDRDYARIPGDIDLPLREREWLSARRPLSPHRPYSPVRSHSPLPPLPPIDRYLEDRWRLDRELADRDFRERGELRIREYPERPLWHQDRNRDLLPDRSEMEGKDGRWYPPEERGVSEGLNTLPPPLDPASTVLTEQSLLPGGEPSTAGVLALSQRQHEIILKAAQELKMLREQKEQLDNLKSFFGDPNSSDPHGKLPSDAKSSGDPQQPPSVNPASGKDPMSSAGRSVGDPFSGLWDEKKNDSRSAGFPVGSKLPGIQKTVDYAHGRDLAIGKVEQTPYGERVVLLPEPAIDRGGLHSYQKDFLIDSFDLDLRNRDPYYERTSSKSSDRRDYDRDRSDTHRDRSDHERDRDRHSREDRSSYRDKESSSRRGTSDKPPYDRKSERTGYDVSSYGGSRRGYAEERPVIPPPLAAPPPEKKPETKNVDDLLKRPGRANRPDRIVVIMRGLPGSGKTHVAKLIRDKEVEFGGSAPRVLSLDDYFITEVEKVEKDPETGKKIKTKVMEYEYEPEMEETYRSGMLKTFKKTLDDGFFPFIILDSIHDRVRHFEQFWSAAKTKGFEVYLAEITADTQTCAKRNVHSRKPKEINKMADSWEPAPRHMIRLDIRSLLQDAAIEEVEMEDSEPSVEPQKDEKKKKEAAEEEDNERVGEAATSHRSSRNGNLPKSKWEMDTSEAKLDKLDGLKVNKRKRNIESVSSRMEDYLQLPDDYDTRESEPGKKRVRWADLEEKKDADRKRAIGFVVGQTDWDKITDKSGHLAERALNRTKYI